MDNGYISFCISDYNNTTDYVELSRLAYALGIHSEEYEPSKLYDIVHEKLKLYDIDIPPLHDGVCDI